MHYGGTHVEVLIELVVKVESEQCFALGAVGGLVLEGDADVGTGIDDALVDYGHHAHIVVHRIVGVFGQRHAAGCHHHRSARHIHGIQAYLRTARSLIFALEHKFILILKLLRHGER